MCTVLLPPGGYQIAVNKYIIYHIERDRISSVGMTCYGLDVLGFESRWWGDFSYPSTPAQSPMQWVPVLCPGGEVVSACALCLHGMLWGKCCYLAGSGICSCESCRALTRPHSVCLSVCHIHTMLNLVLFLYFFIFPRMNFENLHPHT